MPVSAQAAFAVCAGLLFLVGVLDAIGVIPLVLRLLSVGGEAEGRERVAVRRGRGGSRVVPGPLLAAIRSVGSVDNLGRAGSGHSYALRRGPSRGRGVGQQGRESPKGGRHKAAPGIGGGWEGKSRRTKLRRGAGGMSDEDQPLADGDSGNSPGSSSSGVSRGSSGYTLSESASSSEGRYLYSPDGEQRGEGSSVTADEKYKLLGSDYTTDTELGGRGGGGGMGGSRGGGGGLRRSSSTFSSARRTYDHPDDGDGRWASSSDLEAGGGRGPKGPYRRATFSTPAAEQILAHGSVLPTMSREDTAVVVVTWERLLGAFLCFCSLLSLLGSYVAMHGLPEGLLPGRRLEAPPDVGVSPVLQEEQA